MASRAGPHLRPARGDDAEAVARLHADSWRRHYRGAYSDAFLDGDVLADRLAVWGERLHHPDPRSRTVIAEDGGLVGFAHILLDHDAVWGALLDNMHVTHGHKRQGIGSRLLAWAAQAAIEGDPHRGLYLWVLEQNSAAQAFYEARGGRRAGREPVSPPGGVVSRLAGSPAKLRYVFTEPSRLAAPGAR